MHERKPTHRLSALVKLVLGLELSNDGIRRGQLCPGMLKTYATNVSRFIAVELYEDTLIDLKGLAHISHRSVSLTVAQRVLL